MTSDQDQEKMDAAVRDAMREVQRDMFNFLKSRLGNEHDAADVLHDFYIKVLTRIGDLRDSEKLRAWMRQVLKTTLIDFYRKRSKRHQAETDFHYLDSLKNMSNDDEALDSFVCMCLYKLLPTLKPEYAEILWRADLIAQSRESIAAELNISESNVRVRLHRARLALRQRLELTCRTCPVHGYLDCDCAETENLQSLENKLPL